MSRDPIPTWYFAVAVVQRGEQFLLVRERKFGQRWYFPGGRVTPGESFVHASVRKTQEEAECAVRITGIYRIEHIPRMDAAQLRVVFSAKPLSDAPVKSAPDEHTLEAGWFTLGEIGALPLRGAEVLTLLCEVVAGAPVYPLSLLGVD